MLHWRFCQTKIGPDSSKLLESSEIMKTSNNDIFGSDLKQFQWQISSHDVFFLLNCVPADAVRVVEARPVKEQDDGFLIVVPRSTLQTMLEFLLLLELRLLGPEPLRQGFVLHVGEPDGRLGQIPLGVAMVDVVDKVHVAFQADEVTFSTDLAMTLCLGVEHYSITGNGTKDGGINRP